MFVTPDRRRSWKQRLARVRAEQELAPDRAPLWLRRARLEWLLGQRVRARRAVARARELDERSASVHAWSARMDCESGRIRRALVSLARALALDAREPTAVWVSSRWARELARAAATAGDPALQRLLLARAASAVPRGGRRTRETAWERRLRRALAVHRDPELLAVLLESIKRRNAFYRALADLNCVFDGPRRWLAWLVCTVALATIVWGQMHGGWPLLDGVPDGSERDASRSSFHPAQLAAAVVLVLMLLAREEKVQFVIEHATNHLLVRERDHPGLLTPAERALGRRCLIYTALTVVPLLWLLVA